MITWRWPEGRNTELRVVFIEIDRDRTNLGILKSCLLLIFWLIKYFQKNFLPFCRWLITTHEIRNELMKGV